MLGASSPSRALVGLAGGLLALVVASASCTSESGGGGSRGGTAGSVAGTTGEGGAANGAGHAAHAGATGGVVHGSAGAGGAVAGSAGAWTGTAGNSSSGSGGMPAVVTWSEHIAPIVFHECAGCHRTGGIAPFPLTTYAEASQYASELAAATADRYMPPMPVDNSGACNTYVNARWLTDAEIALFGEWSRQGAAEGDASRTPELPAAPGGLPRVDVTLDPGASYTPSTAREDDYRCFIVDAGLERDAYLVGYEVVPGHAHIVHHVIVYAPESDAASAEAEALDEAQAGLGYECFGGPGVEARPLVLWAPGGGPLQLPAGTGLPMSHERKLVMQVHYNLQEGTFADHTTVRLQTAADVEHSASFQPIADLELNVPPGQALGMTTRTYEVEDPTNGRVYGVLPHMHTLGRTLRVDARLPEGDRCLVHVDRWDFHWQNAWWYDTPIDGAASSVTISCGFDTRQRSTPVTWGEGTQDEMCLAYLYMTRQ